MADIDFSAWHGSDAMSQAVNSADPAATLNEICAGKRAGDPELESSHALPHHYPGKGPNADGVRNAEARFNQTEGLSNKPEAKAHLDNHMKQIQAADKK